ncbi:unnamed protein product [Haemonchus placei]|uniref:PINc domain-containing protein n=1 Tax=Haemonchus placei TaxID=6290 RepID=A0A0N4X238_HAEPC|nr:unnamed protein product [Haemonchus placei]
MYSVRYLCQCEYHRRYGSKCKKAYPGIYSFPVLTELDRLNKSSGNNELRAKARVAIGRLRQLHSSRQAELEDSNDSRRCVDVIMAVKNGERTSRCAYLFQTALLPDCLQASKTLFMTNDCNLYLKAAAYVVEAHVSFHT